MDGVGLGCWVLCTQCSFPRCTAFDSISKAVGAAAAAAAAEQLSDSQPNAAALAHEQQQVMLQQGV